MRFSKLIAGVLAVGLDASGRSESTVPASGTLVVAIASREGLVVCADKRTFDKVRGDRDTDIKLVALTKNVLQTSTGKVSFYDIKTNTHSEVRRFELAFDADAVTSEFFAQHEFADTDAFWNAFGEFLRAAFMRYLSARTFGIWPETGDPPNHVLFQLGFFWLDNRGEIKAAAIQFGYVKQQPPQVAIILTRIPMSVAKSPTPIVLGNTAVYNELAAGNDKRFSAIRSETKFMNLLRGKRRLRQVSAGHAQRFARRLIGITSERTHEVEASDSHVGPTADCALLSQHDGVKWLSTPGKGLD